MVAGGDEPATATDPAGPIGGVRRQAQQARRKIVGERRLADRRRADDQDRVWGGTLDQGRDGSERRGLRPGDPLPRNTGHHGSGYSATLRVARRFGAGSAASAGSLNLGRARRQSRPCRRSTPDRRRDCRWGFLVRRGDGRGAGRRPAARNGRLGRCSGRLSAGSRISVRDRRVRLNGSSAGRPAPQGRGPSVAAEAATAGASA